MKTIGKQTPVRTVCSAALIAAIVAGAAPLACWLTQGGMSLYGGPLTAPSIASWKATDARTVEIVFSAPAAVTDAVIAEAPEGAADEIPSLVRVRERYATLETAVRSTAERVVLECAEPLAAGKRYVAYGVTEDARGNSLTFALPVRGFNARVPKLAFAAVHPKYGSGKRGGETVYRNEFVTVRALTAGNLAGVRLVSAADGADKAFEFPALEVTAGMLVTAHLRSKGDGCVSETPQTLAACRQEYASARALDVWSPNDKAVLGDECDVLWLENGADASLLAAVAYAPSGTVTWENGALRTAAETAAAAGLLSEAGPEGAIAADKVTASKMIALKKITASGTVLSASDWEVRAVRERGGANTVGR